MVRCAWLLVVVLATIGGRAALASPADEAAARFQEGLQLFQVRRYTAAREAFEHAFRISPNVRVLANVAACLAHENRPVEAVRTYRRFMHEAGSDVPASALEAAQREVERLRRAVGDITLAVEPDGAEVRIDGEPAGRTPLSAPIAVAPGRRVLEVRKAGYLPLSRSVQIGANREVALSIALERLPEGAEGDDADPPPGASRGRHEEASRVLVWSGVGVAAALAVAGAVMGTLALGQLDEYDDADTSRQRRSHLYDSMRALATITDVLLDSAVLIGTATAVWALWPRGGRGSARVSLFPGACRVEGRCGLAFVF